MAKIKAISTTRLAIDTLSRLGRQALRRLIIDDTVRQGYTVRRVTQHMNMPALIDFVAVAQNGGFGRASRAVGRPKATLSRRVRDLETQLGVRLFERNTRSFRLTSEGEHLAGHASSLLAGLDELAETLQSSKTAAPSGPLRISAPLVFSHAVLGRVAAEYAAAFPMVRLEIVAQDRKVNIIEDAFDVVIEINPQPDSKLVGRCVLRDEMMMVSTPAFASVHGPVVAADAAGIPAIVLPDVSPDTTWQISSNGVVRHVRPIPIASFSSRLMIRDACLTGVGAAVLPRSLVFSELNSGQLICWGLIEGGEIETWALHLSRRLMNPRIRTFLDFLVGRLHARMG